jgi:hypothetical protein
MKKIPLLSWASLIVITLSSIILAYGSEQLTDAMVVVVSQLEGAGYADYAVLPNDLAKQFEKAERTATLCCRLGYFLFVVGFVLQAMEVWRSHK